jgi:SAM-dependent methyltransferase
MSEKKQISDDEIILNQINMLSVAEGFFHSGILFALLKLNIFERIGEGSKTVQELAEELNTRPDTLARLLNAGVVLKLLISKDGVNYKLSPPCCMVMLPSAGENFIGNFILNLDYLRNALSKLDEAVLKSGPTIDPTTHLGGDKDRTWDFTLAMHNYASHRGKELVKYLDTSGCKTLVDLGCGPGTYAFHLAGKNPNLKIYLADLPNVLKVTKEIEKRYGIKNEVHYLPLDAVKEELPGSYDMIFVSNTLHMLGERASRDLIKRLYKSVNKGGSLVIQAQFLLDTKMGGRWPVFLDLLQLCVTSAGRNHSAGETKEWMMDAGFVDIEFNPMTILNTNNFLRGYKR